MTVTADAVTTLLQNASDLLAASLDHVSASFDHVSARLAEITVQPAHFRLLLLPPPAEGADFDPAAVRHRLAHAALCLAEMFFFIFAIAFFKRFFNLEIVVGFRRQIEGDQGNLLLEEVEENNRRNSLLPKAVKRDDDEDVHNESKTTEDSSGTPEGARHLDRFETSNGIPSPKGRTRSRSTSSLSSLSSSPLSELSEVSSLSSYAKSENNVELEEDEAAENEEDGGASTVPTSDDRQSTDNAVLTFDSNHLAASSQYDRSDCGDEDEDEEPTSFFDDDGDDVPQHNGATKGIAIPVRVTEGIAIKSHTNKRKKTGSRSPSYESCSNQVSNKDEDSEILPPIRDSSFDSGLSWFQEHYGQVWNAVDCESDSEASSGSSR